MDGGSLNASTALGHSFIAAAISLLVNQILSCREAILGYYDMLVCGAQSTHPFEIPS